MNGKDHVRSLGAHQSPQSAHKIRNSVMTIFTPVRRILLNIRHDQLGQPCNILQARE